MSPDNLKHLSNAMLGHIYQNPQKGTVLVEHLKEDGEIPKFYLPTIGFYASVLYSLRDDTIYKSLEEMANLDAKHHSGTSGLRLVMLKNNLAWTSLWANIDKPK